MIRQERERRGSDSADSRDVRSTCEVLEGSDPAGCRRPLFNLRGRIPPTHDRHESPKSDPDVHVGTVFALSLSRHARTVPMCVELQEVYAQGDSSPVQASLQQETRPRCAS